MIEHSSDLPPKIRISIKTLQIYTKSFVGATNCNKKKTANRQNTFSAVSTN